MTQKQADVRATAEGLLARREHSCQELTRKLQQRGYPAEMIVDVIAALQTENLLSDARFAESYAYHRSQKGYGLQRIQMELGERGVSDDVIAMTCENIDIDWFALAQHVQRKRFKTKPGRDLKARAQQQRFLYYRGFNAEQIAYALDEREMNDA